MEILSISILILLTLCSAYCSSTEVAFFSLSPMQIKAYQTDPLPRKRLIAQLLSHPRDLLVTIFMLNTIVNILLQNVSSGLSTTENAWLMKIWVPLILTLLFGEILPKAYGLQKNISLSYRVAPSIAFLNSFFKPIRSFIITITLPLSKILFFFLKREDSISMEELKHVLKHSKKQGILNDEQAELVSGYLDLQDVIIKEIMRPKDDILFYDMQQPLTKLIHLFVEDECSRLPVCDGELEKMQGILSAKSFLLAREEVEKGQDLLPFLNKPFYVPENTPAKILLRRFEEKNESFALVVDEYGSICGLVTQEDLLEIVVGEIEDLRDKKKLYTKTEKGELIAQGKMELEEFNECMETELTSQFNMQTIGGWLMEQMGEVPKSGIKFEKEGILFQILAATPTQIKRLYVRKILPIKKGS